MTDRYDWKLWKSIWNSWSYTESAPVLSKPNFDSQFMLAVDAIFAAHAVLMQEGEDGVDYPICNFS